MNDTRNITGNGKSILNISVFDLLVILYFLHKLLPAVGYYMPGIVYFGIFALLFMLSFNRIGIIKKLNVLGSMSLLFLGALLECVKYALAGSVMSAPIYLYGEFQILLFGLAILSYDAASREYKKKYLFWFVVACYVFTAITTTLGNIRYSIPSRLLATTDSADSALYLSQNIGSFTFVYELVLVTPLFIYMFKKNIINRFISVGLVVMFGLTIIKTEYTTALLLFVLSMILFFIPNLTNSKIFIALMIFVVLLIFNSTYIAEFLRNIGQSLKSEVLATRLDELAAILSGDDIVITGNAGTRTELYKKSFNTIVNSYFAGGWDSAVVGGHSYILDTMAKFGFLGAFTIVVMYKTVYSLFIKPYKTKDFYCYLLYIYLVAIVLAFINPKIYLFVFIAVFPLFAKAMEQHDIKNKED